MANRDDEGVGIRLYEVHKTQDVDKGIGVLRSIHRIYWAGLEEPDIQHLRWILGEAWGLMGQKLWDSLVFADLTWDQVLDLLDIAKEVDDGALVSTEAAQRAQKVLTK